MFEQLYDSIHKNVSLTDEEWELCKNSFRPKRMRKRQFLLQEGDHCREITFIEKGALFSYSVDDKGNQHVMQFGFEGWWIADLHSFFTDTPSTLNIELMENSELLMLDRSKHEELIEEIPGYESYIRIIFQNAYVALQQRVENALGLTAEEKYSRLIKRSPEFMNRVPLNLVASYLGVSPETLSRVRGQMSK